MGRFEKKVELIIRQFLTKINYCNEELARMIDPVDIFNEATEDFKVIRNEVEASPLSPSQKSEIKELCRERKDGLMKRMKDTKERYAMLAAKIYDSQAWLLKH